MSVKRARKRRGWVVMKFFFFFYLIVGIFSAIWLRTAIVNLEYEIGKWNAEKEALLREEKLLMAKRANLYSAMMIEDVATKRLGMNRQNRENIFYVKEATSAGIYKASLRAGKGGLKERLIWK